MIPSFIQVHTLRSFSAALINRDDVGLAKRMPLGGCDRGRISSQCLKRSLRTHDGPDGLISLKVPDTIRSRELFERLIVAPLVDEGFALDAARRVVGALRDIALGKAPDPKDGKKSKTVKKDDEIPPVHTDQVVVLGRPEVDHLLTLAREAIGVGGDARAAVDAVVGKDGLKNLNELVLGGGLSAALFGRMTTSDALARCDSAIHVAHAITTHAIESEPDHFSAIDDLTLAAGGLGSGHIGVTELTSGVFYGYVVVDVAQLAMNLTGCSRDRWRQEIGGSVAGAVLDRLVSMLCTVSPGAKRGSTAPYSYAQLALVEAGDLQPRTLGGAFLRPVRAQKDLDLLQGSIRALASELSAQDRAYGGRVERRVLSVVDDVDAFGVRVSLPALRSWVSSLVGGGT